MKTAYDCLQDCPHCGKKMNKEGSFNFVHFRCEDCNISQMVPVKLLEKKK